jgi:hypothetical protein
MRGGVAHRAPPLVVNLRRRDVFVAEQVLDGFNRHAGIEQRRRSRADYCDQELSRIAFANMLDYSNIENGRNSEYPDPITTICKNGLIASIP